METTAQQIPIDEHQFRLTVCTSLTKLEGLAESTDEHLGRLNGSVARHDADIGKLKEAVLTEQVEGKTTKAWWHQLAPLIWLVVGGVLVLFLLHADALLRVFSKP